MGSEPAEWTIQRIGVVGAGAMGSSLASMIGQVAPIVMVCRSSYRASHVVRDGVKTTGLIEASARPIVVRSIADLTQAGGISVLFIATKTTAIPSVAAELKPLLGRIADQSAGLFVVSFQNGIEPGRQLIELLDYPRVLRMVLNLGATMRQADEIVDVTFQQPPNFIGTLDPAYIPACREIANLLCAAGFETVVAPDIETEVWKKGIINAATNPVCALVNSSVGEVLNSPSRMIVDCLLKEGLAVAQAEGVKLDDGFVANAYGILDSAHNHTPSMVEDIHHGRESEVGQLNRQIIEHARKLAVATPTHEIIDALIETFDFQTYARGGKKGRAASADGTCCSTCAAQGDPLHVWKRGQIPMSGTTAPCDD